jgi:hypothetical protein
MHGEGGFSTQDLFGVELGELISGVGDENGSKELLDVL